MKYFAFFFFYFVSVLISSQNLTLNWVKGFGGTGYDGALSISLDNFGNAYVTGEFEGNVDFDPSPNTFSLTSNGMKDVFVSKFDPLGNFIWAKSVGGIEDDYGYSIEIDGLNSVLVAGFFNQTVDFNPDISINNLTSMGGRDIFILKLNDSGSYIWAKSMGGSGDDQATTIVCDNNNNIYTAGVFLSGADFDPGPATFSFNTINYDAFISKLDANGNFVLALDIGQNTNTVIASNVNASKLSLDASGNMLLTGHFTGLCDFDPSLSTYTVNGGMNSEAYALKLDPNGTFIWAKCLSGSSFDYGHSICSDSNNNVYVTGSFKNVADFDPSPSTYTMTAYSNDNTFIWKLDLNGNFIWAIKFASGVNSGWCIQTDSQGNIYTSGKFNGVTDFDPSPSNYDKDSNGNPNGYICKLDQNSNFLWAKTYLLPNVNEIAINSQKEVFATGLYTTLNDFDSDPPVLSLNCAGSGDAYIFKLGDQAVSLNDKNYSDSNLYLYPNPSNEKIFIQNEQIHEMPISVMVQDLLGNIVIETTLTNRNFGNFIDVSNLQNGIYFLEIFSENKNITTKIMVCH